MIFSIKIFDKEDDGSLRDANRAAHLDYLKDFDEATLFAGPLLSDDLKKEKGSIRLIDLPDRAAAEKNVEDEPYVIAGLQYGPEIHRWSPSVPYTWRDCPRIKGNVQYLIHAIDKPNVGKLRDELRAEHESYQASVSGLYITRGPLMDNDGEQQVGSLMIIDVPDLAAAKEFWDKEPFNYGGLFEKVEFYGWRFGRVFDRPM